MPAIVHARDAAQSGFEAIGCDKIGNVRGQYRGGARPFGGASEASGQCRCQRALVGGEARIEQLRERGCWQHRQQRHQPLGHRFSEHTVGMIGSFKRPAGVPQMCNFVPRDRCFGKARFQSRLLARNIKPVEIVDVFRKSDAVPEIVDEAIAVGAKVLWLQEGVFHAVAEEKARKAGLVVISDRCILKEHARL